MISHKHKCIFIHAPKTAGESMETVLMGRPNWEKDDPNWKSLGLPSDSKVGQDKHWPLDMWKGSPYFEEYFKFGFVRNPWDAAVSFFHYRQRRHDDPTDSLTFEEYIKIVNPILWSDYLAPLRFFMVNGKVGMDFIGRFETLERDWAYVCGRLGMINLPLPRVNEDTKKDHYSDYYTDFSREYIREKCAKDIEYFGYTFENKPTISSVIAKPVLRGISKSLWINLDRRTDRADHIRSHLPFAASRISAVDGATLEFTSDVKKLFPKNYSVLTKAEIACCLSHYYAWKELAKSSSHSSYLILEDDVVFKKGFAEAWNSSIYRDLPSEFYLIYLGGNQPWNQPKYPEVLQPYNKHFNLVGKNDFFIADDHFWHMNTQSYIISKECASLLCQYVETLGFNRALDHFLIHFVNKNKLFSRPEMLYHSEPLWTYQLHEEGGNTDIPMDSDIRVNQDTFDAAADEITGDSELTIIWQFDPNNLAQCYERDWIRELFSDVNVEETVDGNFTLLKDNSLIIYNDLHKADVSNDYTDKLYAYLHNAKALSNCSIMHLGDEFTHARTGHYKDFKNVIRTTFNKNVSHMKNVLQIPLGYKQGFHD